MSEMSEGDNTEKYVLQKYKPKIEIPLVDWSREIASGVVQGFVHTSEAKPEIVSKFNITNQPKQTGVAYKFVGGKQVEQKHCAIQEFHANKGRVFGHGNK